MSNCKVIAISNQKGGVGKTATAVNLAAALTRMGKRVLAVDLDPQGNLTMSLGYEQPDELPITISQLLQETINRRLKPTNETLSQNRDFILKTEGINFIAANIELAAMENVMINIMSRENVLKDFLSDLKSDYDYIIIDCLPSLNILTVNALNAADEVIIPVQAQYLSAKGLELLLQTISMVKRNLNPNLDIAGVLITMLDRRTNFQKEVAEIVTQTYGQFIRIFDSKIPVSVKVTETQSKGKSIFEHDPKGKIADSYALLAKELVYNG